MEAHQEVRRIRKMLWALIGLSLLTSLVVNLSLGWGGIKQRDQSALLAIDEKVFAEEVAKLNLLIRVGTTEIRLLLDQGEKNNPIKGVKALQNLDVSLKALLENTHEDNKHLIRSLIIQSDQLLSLLIKAEDWRGRNDRIGTDLGKDITLNKVRRQLTVIHTLINGIVGKGRLKMTLDIKKYQGAEPSEVVNISKSIIEQHKELLRENIGTLLTELADIQRLVEVLSGERNYDHLPDIKDNKLKPSLGRLARGMSALKHGSAQEEEALKSEILTLNALLFGEGYLIDEHHQTIHVKQGGLYTLIKDHLELQILNGQIREELEKTMVILDRNWIEFVQIEQARQKEVGLKAGESLSATWIAVSLISLIGVMIFLILIWFIFKAVSKQVDTLSDLRQQAEASNEAKSNFLASMSHELRTPLNAIIGFSDIMKLQTFGPLGSDKYHEYCSDISQSGLHLLDIINDILDVSSIEARQIQLNETQLNFPEILNDAIQMIRLQAQEADVVIENEVENNGPALFADMRLVKQVIVNLLSNAVKFTPAKGTIRITKRFDHKGQFCLAVTDTGIGMDDDGVEVAFTPFGMVKSAYESNAKGTGLGLPLAKRMMELHGGTITIESQPKLGTRVTLVFPTERIVTSAATD
ncbi:sensor histidine kinase [Kiloniella antarctica]|uniref:histidine kinase n=1 Tax=Kiloniella antarctica TaxID=1550907 RepID=A0ABW5BL85_9PROT